MGAIVSPGKLRGRGLATIGLSLALAACGSADMALLQPAAAPGSAAATTGPATKTGLTGRNYVEMSFPWLQWDGTASAIQVSAETGLLLIPAPSGGSTLRTARQQYSTALPARRYQLAIDSTDPSVAALIFLYDASGQLLMLPNHPDELHVANPGEPFSFDAPAGIAGFFVQVQSGWQATTTAEARVRLVDIGPPLGNELIDPRGPWINWDGSEALVSYNALIDRVHIQPPPPGSSVRSGVQYLADAIEPGARYEMSLGAGSTTGAAMMLFLFDAQGSLLATDDLFIVAADTTGTGGSSGVVREFVAPAGAASAAVQVQGAWQIPDSALVEPRLRLLPDAQ